MSDFLKTSVTLVLIVLFGLLVWKIVNWKHVETSEDIKKNYNITCTRILLISKALEMSLEEMNKIPVVDSIGELKDHVERYITVCPIKDQWGNDFLYHALDDSSYEIASAGSDGVFDGFDQKGDYLEYENNDIIIKNGAWKFAFKNQKY